MKVLVIGGGGREHALCWKISRSPLLAELYCAPGNAGIAKVAQCVAISDTDCAKLVEFGVEKSIDLVVVGPEAPLVAGVADAFREKGINVFGPGARAAEIEGSKAFARELCRAHKIPGPAFWVFQDSKRAMGFLGMHSSWPLVVKASGLAAGKGVIICENQDEAMKVVQEIMEDGRFGKSGTEVVIEEFMDGPETSILTITDGRTIIPLEPAQDHKRAYDGDEGPNTGGMGAITPTPVANPRTRQQVESQVLIQTIHAMNHIERPYSGVLYAGLMITSVGPRLLEFNARFGDPEIQPLVLRMKSDLLPILDATARGKLDEVEPIEWDERDAICIVAASEGYPGPYENGKAISGLDDIEESDDLVVFHAGTTQKGDKVVTNGGRVLGVTALGTDRDEARLAAEAALEKISFDGMWHRTDIGKNIRLPGQDTRPDPREDPL